MSAQIPEDATREQLNQIKEAAVARRQAYEALIKADEAKVAFEARQEDDTQALAAQSAASKAQKEAAEALTALANAQKAQAEAQWATSKAKFGEVPASGYSGAVDLATDAGSAEAFLLSTLAVNDIAESFAAHLVSPCVVLATASTVPDFQALTAFRAEKNIMQNAFDMAQCRAPVGKGEGRALIPGEVGLGLEAINKLLAFAKTDYHFVAYSLTGSDVMLLNAVADQLNAKGVKAQIPSLYMVDIPAGSNEVLDGATAILKLSGQAKVNIEHFEAAQAKAEKELSANPTNQALKDVVQKMKDSVAVWKPVSGGIDAWAKRVVSVDDKGKIPLATILSESLIRKDLESGWSLMVIQLHKVAGTGYTKKNLWSSLGRNPFFVTGGAVAGYVEFDGHSGYVLSSMLMPVHGGYHSVSDVERVVNNGAKGP